MPRRATRRRAVTAALAALVLAGAGALLLAQHAALAAPGLRGEVMRFQFRACFLAPRGTWLAAGVLLMAVLLARRAAVQWMVQAPPWLTPALLGALVAVAAWWAAPRFGLTLMPHGQRHWPWIMFLPALARNALLVAAPAGAGYIMARPWQWLRGAPAGSRVALCVSYVLLTYMLAALIFIHGGRCAVE